MSKENPKSRRALHPQAWVRQASRPISVKTFCRVWFTLSEHHWKHHPQQQRPDGGGLDLYFCQDAIKYHGPSNGVDGEVQAGSWTLILSRRLWCSTFWCIDQVSSLELNPKPWLHLSSLLILYQRKPSRTSPWHHSNDDTYYPLSVAMEAIEGTMQTNFCSPLVSGSPDLQHIHQKSGAHLSLRVAEWK